MGIITTNPNERVEMFIDLMNIETVAGRGRVDYPLLCRILANGRQIRCVRVYDHKGDDPEQEMLHRRLKEDGFRLVVQKTRAFDANKQVGVDVRLSVDVTMCALESGCDTIIVVSGDGDFCPLIESIKMRGKKAEFASFEECANRCLVEDADRFLLLDNIPMLRLEGSS